jgi:hypothetical protein
MNSMSNDQHPKVIAEIMEASSNADRPPTDEPTLYGVQFVYAPDRTGADAVVIAAYTAEMPIPVPRVGDRVELQHCRPVIVQGVTTKYEISEDHGGLYVGADVDVVPVLADGRAEALPEGRVRVRVLLLVGDQAEIVADAADVEGAQRYAAAVVAADTGVEVSQLPGMRLSALVGDDGRLSGFRTAE